MYKCGRYGKGDLDGVKRNIEEYGAAQVAGARRPEDSLQRTCLHYAAKWGRKNIISLLVVENGADLEPKTVYGETPLRLAIRWHKYASITTLLKLGADLEKAKDSNYGQSDFDRSMKYDKKTAAAIAEGQGLAGDWFSFDL